MQIAPRNARPRNPENPIQNKTMVPRATTTARAPLNHEWFKAGPFLVTHQTPKHDSLPKSYRESETTPVGNPLCQQLLDIWSCLHRHGRQHTNAEAIRAGAAAGDTVSACEIGTDLDDLAAIRRPLDEFASLLVPGQAPLGQKAGCHRRHDNRSRRFLSASYGAVLRRPASIQQTALTVADIKLSHMRPKLIGDR